MSRRVNEDSEESAPTLSPAVVNDIILAERFLSLGIEEGGNDEEVIVEVNDSLPPATTLHRYFSVRSVLSTTSSQAIEQQEAADTTEMTALREIGSGMCGMVFDIVGTGYVVKRATGATFFAKQIKQDFESHKKLYKSHHNIEDVMVPKPIEFVDAAGCFDWQQRHNRWFKDYDARYREPASILVSQRIFPLPKLIRGSLIQLFCPQPLQWAAKDDKKNKSCLVRIYLGVRRTKAESHDHFSLRNFELTLDLMADIGLNPIRFADNMGSSLATMHWDAKVDGRDVEYVLGSAPSPAESTDCEPKKTPLNFLRRTVNLWLLDFNQCEPINVDEVGVEQCFKAFWDNDPYYPRPNVDTALWKVFRTAYVKRGDQILPRSPLPEMLMTKIEAKAAANTASKATPSAPPPPPPFTSQSQSEEAGTPQTRGRHGRKTSRVYA